ncbi:MAG TPA: ABC transporter permease [Flavobacteriaceae bacterium]|nr:ABC transporter permease [Flavobacteriaceae bacterium]MCB9212294.1 ABC transporter permease [Alteromonas sp.]HPF10327.1 ABC transporter permease [Flavobacteriaceae bacterium]HQU20391.1 ABC transporter permease [Flavobacteriaceae bacterium]HQU65729.1 ABC transporter permease [Flavobacteriaceae bacterium]
MFNRDRWNEILEALNANRFRTFLTAFGVFWGIFILVILLALTNGLKNGVQAGFGDFATNSIFMWSQRTSIPYKGFAKGRGFNFKIQDVQVLKAKFPELKYVSPRNQLGGFRGANNVTRNEKTGAFNIYGDYPEYIDQEPMDITAGRFLSYSDIQDKRKVAIIGKDVAKALYDEDEEPLGSYIKINGINFMVIGTFKKSNSQGDQEEDANTIFIPFTTFSQAFNYGDNVGWMAITANDNVSITNIKPKIMSVMRELRSVHPDDERAIGNFDLAEEFSRVMGLFTILTFVGYFVGALVLMSGVIGISNIMLIVVKERTKEIGVRRAIGASPWSIRLQILQESLVLTIVSGMTGIAFAAGIIWALNFLLSQSGPVENFANPTVGIGVVITALLILVISGVLAGLIPATRATQMKPVDALRME